MILLVLEMIKGIMGRRVILVLPKGMLLDDRRLILDYFLVIVNGLLHLFDRLSRLCQLPLE